MNFHQAEPEKDEADKLRQFREWLGDRSMWDDPSECSKKAKELKLTGIMGNKHNSTKIIHKDARYICYSDRTCLGSLRIELG